MSYLGGEEFTARVKKAAKGNRKEQTALRGMERGWEWEKAVSEVEKRLKR